MWDFFCTFALDMQSPFILPPSPEAQKAAAEVIEKVHAYMHSHPESELHRCGKMFGVLVYNGELMNGDASLNGKSYLAAFSAKLDGSYHHEGFVPPVYEMAEEPVGTSREESRRLQQLLFANYRFVNGKGEQKNLLEIFQDEKIISAEEWFNKSGNTTHKPFILPPSGAGECCAPKLLQYALTHGLQPVAMAEFWVGAPSKTEIRQEGAFYAPCSGKCVPILRHVLQGLDIISPQPSRVSYSIETLYEDAFLIVVNKPAGLLSVPGKGEEPSVESYLRLKLEDLRFLKAVHRLDQDTSGLLVLAKTPEVYKELQSYFQRRDILKRYEAVIEPNDRKSAAALPDEGTITLPLLPNPYDRPRQMVNLEHGKVAITRYAIRERRKDGTILVDLYPLTGRTHQLRVHAAHTDGLHAPILGDRLYSANRSTLTTNRLLLHAAEIRFVHPITKEEMHFYCNWREKNLASAEK